MLAIILDENGDSNPNVLEEVKQTVSDSLELTNGHFAIALKEKARRLLVMA